MNSCRIFQEDKERFPVIEEKKSTRKLSVWVFGGQKVFDVLYNLYLTSDGFCILVFNLRNLCLDDQIKEKEADQLNNCLNSLQIHSENMVIFVGTRCESEEVKKVGLKALNKMF